MAASRSVRLDLIELLDRKAVVAPEDMAPYEKGYRYGAGRAVCVVRPGSVEDLRTVVEYCVRHRMRLVVQGGNTGLVGASTPDDSGDQLLINLTRLDGVESIDPFDRTATVLAGTRLSTINQVAAAHGLFFPIDLGADPTIGGMVSTNTGGSRMLRYGDVRQNLLGLEVVLAEENAPILGNLAGLRKSNSGLDWKHVFVGTGGTYGIIARAKINLHPLPRRTAAALVIPRTQEGVPAIVSLLETALGDILTACEGMSKNAMSAAFGHNPSLRNPFNGGIPPYALLVEVGTSVEESIVGDLDAALAQAFEPAFSGASPLVDDVLLGRPEDFWAIRHSISDGVARSGLVIAFDVSVKRSLLPAFRAAAIAMLDRDFPQMQVHDFGHCGDGGDHFNLVWPIADLPPEAERKAVIDAVRLAMYDLVVRDFGGTYSAEHGVGPHNEEFYDRYTPQAQRKLSLELKSLLDPHTLMSNVKL